MIPIKQSLRTLARFKTYTIINLAGLVLSLSCALILMRYIHQEYTVNHFCPELERTFVMTTITDNEFFPGLTRATNPNNEDNYIDPYNNPYVERFSDVIMVSDYYVIADGKRYNVKMAAADTIFTSILPRPVVLGKSNVNAPNEALISAQLCKKIFRSEDPLGKTLQTSTGKTVTVVGVYDDALTKTSFEYDILLSMDLHRSWHWTGIQLVQLHRAEDFEAFNNKNSIPMSLILSANIPFIFQLYPLKDLYFFPSNGTYPLQLDGDKGLLKILMIIVALLLGVGLFNYINLHSVMMQKRGRELAIKKVYGISGREILFQLFMENILLATLALITVWSVMEMTRGMVDYIFNISIIANRWFDLWITFVLVLSIALFTTLYPFIQYRFRLARLSLNAISKQRELFASRTLFMWLQFAVCLCVIIFAIYFTKQMNYVFNYELNFNTEHIIRCKFVQSMTVYDVGVIDHEEVSMKLLETVDRRIKASPLFVRNAFGRIPLCKKVNNMGIKFFNAEKKGTNLILLEGDLEYMELFGYKLVEGRLWDDDLDSGKRHQLIVTESAKHYLEMEDILVEKLLPERQLIYGSAYKADDLYNVVGVIEDFNASSLAEQKPIYTFRYNDQWSSSWREYLFAQIAPGKREEAVSFLRDLYVEMTGSDDFTYAFIEDDVAAMYKSEKLQMRIYITFALIAVFIACLGLFGLSLYDIRQRYREIAIRKINGASKGAIFRLLMRKYVYIIGSAFVVSSAVSYVAIEKYMENFYHRAPLSGWIFVVALLLISVVAFATLWWQVRNAIRLNPAEVIKME